MQHLQLFPIVSVSIVLELVLLLLLVVVVEEVSVVINLEQTQGQRNLEQLFRVGFLEIHFHFFLFLLFSKISLFFFCTKYKKFLCFDLTLLRKFFVVFCNFQTGLLFFYDNEEIAITKTEEPHSCFLIIVPLFH